MEDVPITLNPGWWIFSRSSVSITIPDLPGEFSAEATWYPGGMEDSVEGSGKKIKAGETKKLRAPWGLPHPSEVTVTVYRNGSRWRSEALEF